MNNSIGKEIFKAIHEGKWLSIEYRNKAGGTTKYWIAVLDIDTSRKSLKVDGLHLAMLTTKTLYIFPDGIISATVLDGTYYRANDQLIADIDENPAKYAFLFSNTANLKILNYLSDCNRADCLPYNSDFTLVTDIDADKITHDGLVMTEEQFRQIVIGFQHNIKALSQHKIIRSLCLNLLSIHTEKGLYVLAYRRLELDVSKRMLKPSTNITICKEFGINGERESIRKFIDADDYYLLEDFENNAEIIKDAIIQSGYAVGMVDDMPYIICVERKITLDLTSEYNAIIEMYSDKKPPAPIKAFFGDLTSQSRNRKDYPITLLNSKVNLDQVLAIHNALKYPLTYVQGPPGTGKTSTIINTIISAFFNDTTVLFSSYNNHPIDNVCNTLSALTYKKRTIPFPVLRIGSQEKMKESIRHINELRNFVSDIQIFESTLSKNKADRTEQTKKLSDLLKKYEESIDLRDREEAIRDLSSLNINMNFQVDLGQRQLNDVQKRLSEIGTITDEDMFMLLTDDVKEFEKYLFYTSAARIKRLNEPKYKELIAILDMEEGQAQIREFELWISASDNFKMLLRVFPIVAATCISTHKLGEPEQYFDITIIDEASQCNTAMSLVPILRGKKLMLVGDPQQLNPVVTLDPNINAELRRKYNVSEEYDYIKNSVYKTYLACDSVSTEILLRYHYRCENKIIEFNNRKYYNSKLRICTDSKSDEPLLYCDIPENTTTYKNTSPAEAEEIVQYVKENKGKSIGIITPFSNQKNLIRQALDKNGFSDVPCGTVHAFQGDEKDEILFSLALTDKTSEKTYEWLKNNTELVNVAVSRAKDKLIVLSSQKELDRLHKPDTQDDIYELVNYVRSNGQSQVTSKAVNSRALGIKPYSTETEEAFMTTLTHALGNVLLGSGKCSVKHEVPIAQVFKDNIPFSDLFYTGRFDFVIYQRDYNDIEMPLLAIELDGKEHHEKDVVIKRDNKKNKICRDHGFELIRVENSYARRYSFIKDILIDYFKRQ